MIYEQRTYTNDEGQSVTGRTPVDGGPETFSAGFVFAFNINTPQGVQTAQVQVPADIPAATIGEAFALLPQVAADAKATAEAKIKADIAEAQKPRLAIAGSPPPGNNGQRFRLAE